jgi:hypothetical protein
MKAEWSIGFMGRARLEQRLHEHSRLRIEEKRDALVPIETRVRDQITLERACIRRPFFEHRVDQDLHGHPAGPGLLIHFSAKAPLIALIQLRGTKFFQ